MTTITPLKDVFVPVVRFDVKPLDPQSSYRTPYVLIEGYGGLVDASVGDMDSQGKEKELDNISDAEEVPSGYLSGDWSQQKAFESVKGPLDFVKLGSDGLVLRDTKAAGKPEPFEMSGLTVALRRVRHWNRMVSEPNESLPPRSPKGAKELRWKGSEGNEWETVMPATWNSVSLVRHRVAPANRSVRAATEKALDKDEGFEMVLDMTGVTSSHKGGPALRVIWGRIFSIVFRGDGSTVRVQVEQRDRGTWKVVRKLDEGASRNNEFWSKRHVLRVSRLAGRVIVDLDDTGYHFAQMDNFTKNAKAIRATWPKAPVEVSIFGVDMMFGLSKLSGLDSKGKPREASAERTVKGPQRVSGQELSFKAHGAKRKKTGDGDDTMTTLLAGDTLDKVWIEDGSYNASGSIHYTLRLKCDAYSAPILSSFVAQFPNSATLAEIAPVDLRPAVSQWEVDSGDPEGQQAGQATFSLSRAMLDKFIPDWKSVVVPFRPVEISVQTSLDVKERLFKGYIRPNNFNIEESGDAEISVVCNDVMTERLNESAGLIDERFAPLDAAMQEPRQVLWAADAVRYIIGVVLGPEAAEQFNGNGNSLRYLSPAAPALIDNRQNTTGGLNVMLDISKPNSFMFPPPFGDSALSWINKISGYELSVCYYDPREDAIMYGDPNEILSERGQTIYNGVDAHITRLSSQGEFEHAYNEVKIWGEAPKGNEAQTPSMLMGKAGDDGRQSFDPTSKSQSWPRTLLMKPDFVKLGKVDEAFVQEFAQTVWYQYENALPATYSLEFENGRVGPRWGETIVFVAPGESAVKARCITKVVHRGNLSGGNGPRFSTTIEARSLSGAEVGGGKDAGVASEW